MAKKQHKKSKPSKAPLTLNIPHAEERFLQNRKDSPDIDYPVFCFKYLQAGWGTEHLDFQQAKDFINTLRDRANLSWQQISLSNRHKSGTEQIKIESIKATINANIITPDVKELTAFRFSGKAPFLGLRDGKIFHILFLDPKFKLYNH